MSCSVLILMCLIIAFASAPVSAQAPPPPPQPNAAVKAMASTLNLRQVPSRRGAVIIELAAGTPLIVIGKTRDHAWLNVNTLEGLSGDGLHPSTSSEGYAGAAKFTPENLHYGYVMRNLTALQVLDTLRQQVLR